MGAGKMNSEFTYTIKSDSKKIIAKPIDEGHIDKIINFLKKKRVSSTNYKRLFGFECEPEFIREGALLETKEEEIYAALQERDKYFSICLWGEEEEILALLIIQLDDLESFISDINAFKLKRGFESKWDYWQKLKEDHQIACKGDLVISNDEIYKNVLLILFHMTYRELLRLNRKVCVTEVFHILSCEDTEGIHKLDIFNERSFISQVMGAGAIYVGDGKKKTKKICDEISVTYYPSILEYELERLYELSGYTIKKLNIEVS